MRCHLTYTHFQFVLFAFICFDLIPFPLNRVVSLLFFALSMKMFSCRIVLMGDRVNSRCDATIVSLASLSNMFQWFFPSIFVSFALLNDGKMGAKMSSHMITRF